MTWLALVALAAAAEPRQAPAIKVIRFAVPLESHPGAAVLPGRGAARLARLEVTSAPRTDAERAASASAFAPARQEPSEIVMVGRWPVARRPAGAMLELRDHLEAQLSRVSNLQKTAGLGLGPWRARLAPNGGGR